MSRSVYSIPAIVEKFRDFDRVATQLEMPGAERLNILNVSPDIYAALRAANMVKLDGLPAELERRLTYALPLMRRLAQAQSMVPTSSPYADACFEAAAA